MGCNSSSQTSECTQKVHDSPKQCGGSTQSRSKTAPRTILDKSFSKKRKLADTAAAKSPHIRTLIKLKQKVLPETFLEVDALVGSEVYTVDNPDEGGKLTPPPLFTQLDSSKGSRDKVYSGILGKRFFLGEEIGSGHYATVFMAWDADTGLPYACKRASKKVDPKQMQEELKEQMGLLAQHVSHASTIIPTSLSNLMFQQSSRKSSAKLTRSSTLSMQDSTPREVRIMWNLDHPYVLKCIDYWEDEDKIYMITDLMHGGTLLERLVEKKRYGEGQARVLVRGLLESLVHLHRRHIVHRDLKPDNILLATKSDDTAFRLADFGLSGQLLHEGQTLTRACGTPGYVAPELVNRQPYSTGVDVWAVGVITFALLGGYHPFYSDDEQAVYRRIRKVDYNFDYYRWDAISAAAKAFIRTVLVADPADRPSAAEALQHPWFYPKTADRMSCPTFS